MLLHYVQALIIPSLWQADIYIKFLKSHGHGETGDELGQDGLGCVCGSGHPGLMSEQTLALPIHVALAAVRLS